MYKPFSDVYGTITTEKDRPSLNSSAEKRDHGIPFSPSGQFARNVARTLVCTECGKSRVLCASWKLHWEDQQDLELEVGDIMYICGMDLQDGIPADLFPEAKQSYLFSRIFVRQDMCCTTRIETTYFSSECFDVICSYCGSSDNLLPANETSGMYLLCSTCKSDPTKLGSKRKLVTGSS